VTRAIRVATRRSPLARVQTEWVVRRLARRHPRHPFEVVPIDTSGDQDRSLGGSPDFTDAIDRALERGEADLAVHSAKDLPAVLNPRLALVACPGRADPHDCLVVGESVSPPILPPGARVGSSSPRRRAQLLRWRPDLSVQEVRGNVDTRIGLVRSGTTDAVILAVAGISRLDRTSEIGWVLPTRTFLPAPAQGALAVVARSDEPDLERMVHPIDQAATHACVAAERSFSAALGGDCRIPLGALAKVRGGSLSLTGEVLSPDGRTTLRALRTGSSSEAEAIGRALGEAMRDDGALELRASASG
jgi:hydroxymethylbilane synthase